MKTSGQIRVPADLNPGKQPPTTRYVGNIAGINAVGK